MKTYDSVVSAKLLLALANEKGHALNVTKTQKLLYLIYGYFLANYDSIIFDEAPKAWPFGPVFPRTRKKIDYTKVYYRNNPEFEHIIKDEVLVDCMNKVIDTYAKFSAGTLSEWSHNEGGPWYRMTQEDDFDWNKPIKNEYIKEYFTDFDVF